MENRSQKKIFIIVILLFFTITNINAQIDTRTQNQIKAKFLSAQELYDEKDYSGSLEKVFEIEKLTNGQLLAAAQNLKVKCLIGQNKYKIANDELYKLEGLNLSNDILKNIAGYSSVLIDYQKNLEKENAYLKSKIEAYISEVSKKRWIKEPKGLSRVYVDGKYGYVNKNYDIIIPFEYDGGDNWVNSTYINTELKEYDEYGGTWLYGLIDINNQIIIRHKYHFLGDLSSNGLLAAQLNGKWGYIDLNEKIIIPFKYDNASDFLNGKAKVELEGKKRVIDEKGNIVEPFK